MQMIQRIQYIHEKNILNKLTILLASITSYILIPHWNIPDPQINIPNEFLSEEPTTPNPIKVIVTGDPTKSINSLTSFDAVGPELIHPPPI